MVDLIDAVLEVSVAGGFSRLGYAARSRLLPEFGPKAFPSLAGRTVLITGATSGIGLAAASRLAGLGATVSFLARSRDRAERARSRIAAAAASADHDPDSAGYGLADLDDLDSVRDFAAWFGATHSRLDVLVHNAGAIHPRQQHSPAGLELTAAGQLVAPFLLTHLLLGELRRSAPSRVITVSSGGMYTQRLDLTGLEPAEADYSGVTAYARVKRAQVALSSQWALRTAGSGIAFHAMHPGWVRTPGISQALPRFSRLMGPLLRTPDQGADTLVWLASTDPDQLGSGQFWHDRRPRPVYRFLGAQPGPPDAADQLWDWVATQAGIDPGAAARQDQAAGRAAGRGLPG
ncbi:MAG TPA: SDR family NAD(P)-dependent oxidoreductase [Streptosporangiaceae bacterium]|nr:SDR family NAD(P)-dependent oxidoreductase [Streptosporangiaceae bacterium]